MKFCRLVIIGLFTAVLIYPLLHETGHIVAMIICGFKIEEITFFPLPSVLCKIENVKAVSMVMVGFGGMVLPFLVTAFPPPKRFRLWYIWFLLKIISLMSFTIALVDIYLFIIDKPIADEDMTNILKYASNYSPLFVLLLTAMSMIVVKQMICSEPQKRCIDFL